MKHSQHHFSAALLLALIAFLLYANTINHSYVLDDAGVITKNEYVQQGVAGLKDIFTSQVWHFENINLGYYRPLALATFAIEHQFFPGNAMVSHLNNVLLYAFTAWLLFFILARIFKNRHPLFAFLVTLLFIAHPAHTEVVANIKSRDEMLAFLNLLLATLAMFRAYRSTAKTDIKWLLASCFFYYLSLLSKESAMSAVLLFPLLLFFDEQFSRGEILKRTLPFLSLIAVFLLQKYLAIGTLSAVNGTDLINYPYAHEGSRVASMLMILVWSVKLLIVPHPLLYSYGYNQIPATDWTSPYTYLGVTIVLIGLYLTYKNFTQKSPLAFALLLFGITILPAMAFVLFRGGIFAERLLYAPALAFSILLVSLFWKVSNPILKDGAFRLSSFKQRSLTVFLLLIVVLYSFKTVSRNKDWQNDYTLVSQDVQHADNNCQVHLHYAIKLVEHGIAGTDKARKQQLFTEAVEHLDRAIQIHPGFAEAYYQKGQAYYKLAGNTDSAIALYNAGIMQNSNYLYNYYGLGEVYQSLGKQELASYYYNKAVELNPYFQQMVRVRDRHRKLTGLNVKEFPSVVDSAAVIDNKDFNYYMNEGKASGQRGDYVNAIRLLEKAVSMQPASENALINLSVCLGMTRDYPRSIEVLQQVLAINPNNKTALTNIAILYNHIGNKAKAAEYQQKLDALKSL